MRALQLHFWSNLLVVHLMLQSMTGITTKAGCMSNKHRPYDFQPTNEPVLSMSW